MIRDYVNEMFNKDMLHKTTILICKTITNLNNEKKQSDTVTKNSKRNSSKGNSTKIVLQYMLQFCFHRKVVNRSGAGVLPNQH